MGRRIAYLGLAIALCFSLVASLSLTQGCYDVPQPVCGFVCGTGGACPDEYTCNQADHRCHLNGSTPTTCLGGNDGGMDTMDTIGVDTGDGNLPPSVIGTTPTDQATGVAVNASISATFSEEVFGVNGGTFTVTQGAQPVLGTVLYTSASNPFATFTPSSQLLANTTYTATLSSSITDGGNAPLPTKTWTFTTGADTVAPMVVQRTPAVGATNVTLNSTVTARFDETVIGVSGTTFTLADGATPIAGTVTYTAASRTATFTPTASLPPGRVLTATLTSGITDAASNALSGAPVTWTFTTVSDTTAPMVVMRTPGPGATNVSTATNIVVLFDEAVTGVTAASFTVNDGAAVAGTLTSAMAGREWTFTPSAALTVNATVTVTLTSAIKDLSNNALAGAPVTWTFTTAPDTTAPMVTNRTPAPAATMVATNTTIVVTFDEAVMGVTAATFTVNDGAAVAGTLASSMGGRQWTFTPSAAFANNDVVTVTLTTGIQDLAGNALAAPVTWMFTTLADTTPPTVTNRVPAPSATMVAINTTIVATFSEPVTNVTAASFTVNDGVAVAGTLASSMGGSQWTFTPSAALPNNTVVTVTLTTAITDLASNPLAAMVQWTFTTLPDTIAPTVVTRVPAPNATGVSQTGQVVITFSEPVMNVNNTSFTIVDATTVAGTRTSSNGGRTWTFTPSMQIPGNTLVTVSLTNMITDLAGNALAPESYTYTTAADLTPPMVNARNPGQGAINVPSLTTISATFNEAVMGVNAATFTVNDGSAVAGTIAPSANGTVWTFTPSAPLAQGQLVTVTLTTSITDLSGNPLSSNVSWTFTTLADAMAPTVVTTTPASAATNVPINTTIAVNFSEPVVGVTTSSFTVAASGSVTGTLFATNGGSTWTFTPTSFLPAATMVTVTLTAGITDVNGNPLGGAPVTFSFTTQ